MKVVLRGMEDKLIRAEYDVAVNYMLEEVA